MGDISRYFNRSEFKCPCCGKNTVDAELLDVLVSLRHTFKASVYITSGNRCEAYNKKIGGAEKSQHIESKAADIQVADISPESVYNYLNQRYPNKYGIGKGKTFCHIDVRGKKARWSYD